MIDLSDEQTKMWIIILFWFANFFLCDLWKKVSHTGLVQNEFEIEFWEYLVLNYKFKFQTWINNS